MVHPIAFYIFNFNFYFAFNFTTAILEKWKLVPTLSDAISYIQFERSSQHLSFLSYLTLISKKNKIVVFSNLYC